MRQLLVLLLSFGALVLASGPADLSAQTPPAPVAGSTNVAANITARRVELAEQELNRINGLVAAGALPRIRLEQAKMDLEDAQDEAILDRTLYAGYSKQDSAENSADVVAAAKRLVDRQQARIARAQEIVSAGVAAESTLLPLQQELTLRQTSLNLAKLQEHLAEEAAAQKAVPQVFVVPTPAVDDTELFAQGSEHYEGDGKFDESRQLAPLEVAFESQFERPLPISAEGETEVHRELGFDHRGRVDVAVNPGGPEGTWLRQYLHLHKIPYFAFTHAVPGKATGAHIHIGPESTRLVSRAKRPGKTRIASRLSPRSRNAD
jgi:hypothetical protein